MLTIKEMEDFALNMRDSIHDTIDDLDAMNIGKAKDRLKILARQATQMFDNINRSKANKSEFQEFPRTLNNNEG